MPTKTPAKLRQKNLVNIHGDATQPMQLMDVDDSLPVGKKKQSKGDGSGNGSAEAPSVTAAPERRQTRSSTRTKQNESAAASSSVAGGAVAAAAAAPPTSQPAKRSREESTKVRQSNRSTRTELSHPETTSDPSDAGDADAEGGQQAPSSTMIIKQSTCGNLPVVPETPAVSAPATSTLEAMQTETETVPTEVTPAPPSKPVRKGRGARAGKQTTTKAAPASAKAASKPKALPTQIAATASSSSNSTAPLTASVSRPNPLQLARLQQSPSAANLIQSCQRPGPPKAVAFAPSPASTHQSTKLGNAKRSMSHGDLSRMGKSPGVTQPASARLRAANSNLNLAQTPGNNKCTNAVQKQQQVETANRTANAPNKSQSENTTQPNICVAVTPAAPTAAAAIAAKKQLFKGAETPVANTASPSKNTFSTPAVRLDA